MELTRAFPAEQYAGALASWQWLGLGGREPMMTSPFGDVFFESEDGVWFLDLVEGSLQRPWGSLEELKASLETEEGQDRYLLSGLALGAAARGILPGDTEVYAFTTPPVLGGSVDLDNIEAADFVVAVNLAGQIHAQVKDLPPGTPIAGVTLDG